MKDGCNTLAPDTGWVQLVQEIPYRLDIANTEMTRRRDAAWMAMHRALGALHQVDPDLPAGARSASIVTQMLAESRAAYDVAHSMVQACHDQGFVVTDYLEQLSILRTTMQSLIDIDKKFRVIYSNNLRSAATTVMYRMRT